MLRFVSGYSVNPASGVDTFTFRHDRDVLVPIRDGVELRADIFRASDEEPAPVILTLDPYGKDIHFGDFNAAAHATGEERTAHVSGDSQPRVVGVHEHDLRSGAPNPADCSRL